jgi:ribonuclease BN (tRNA processing enzyme)
MNFRIADTSVHYPTFFGPKGLDKYFLEYSRLTELHSVENWGKIKMVNIQKEQKVGKISIKAFRVLHAAFAYKAQAYAYRFRYGNKVIAFSGDAARCLGIEKACRKADLFVCDCSFPQEMKKLLKIHMNTEQIGQVSQKMGVKKLFLTHFYPSYDATAMTREVRKNFSGEVVKGKDFMVISV